MNHKQHRKTKHTGVGNELKLMYKTQAMSKMYIKEMLIHYYMNRMILNVNKLKSNSYISEGKEAVDLIDESS